MKNRKSIEFPYRYPARNVDKKILKGLDSFISAITPSYSLTSKRYSVFSLLKEHLDGSVKKFKEKNNHRYSSIFLNGFLPSKLKYPPPNTPQQILYEIRKLNTNSKINKVFDLWIENFRSAIISSSFSQEDPEVILSSKGFDETVDHFIYLIYFLQQLKPERKLEKSIPTIDVYDNRVQTKSKYIFCELCWRKANNTDYSRSKFCTFHNPSDPTTRKTYERDLRYKMAFHHELSSMSGNKNSKYLIQFYKFGKHFGMPEFRKAAYDLVHSGINTKYHRLIHNLHLKGNTNVKITQKLGITRQAISKELIFIHKRIENYKRTMYIHPLTDEATDKIYCSKFEYDVFMKKYPGAELFELL